jgi:hypothetical protein
VERIIARLARASWGVVTREQLLAAGITAKEVRHRIAIGALIRIHPGVYRVGHVAPSLEATYLAAVWACGDGALLCGRAAGFLYGMLLGREPPLAEVIAASQRRVRGVLVHRSRSGLVADAYSYRGIPVTTAARTLVDLASSLPLTDLARACHEAGVKHRTSPVHVSEVLARRPRTKGARKLRLIVEGDVAVSLSRLESRFLELLDEANLRRPVTNKPAGGRRVDCRWERPPLTVELDGYGFHNSRHAWEQDRRREREARARGDEFRRYTYGDVFEDPTYMLRELRELLDNDPT